MEGLSAELDFALKSRDPYPINLESLVDLLKYKHISSLTTHLKRHFQRDVDYKKFHQVRNKRQICVYYISVDCFKQICGFCRHTQRKEIAQNLLGNMSTDVKSDEMSFTEMLNDINELNHGDDSEDEDDFKMRQSSPPSKSIKIEKGNFVTKDPQSLFSRYGRPSTHLQTGMSMMKRGHTSFSETTTAPPTFSNNIYNFNNLSAATNTQSITPIIPTPLNTKSSLTTSLAGTAFPSTTFNPSSFTANALANAAISNTNNSFINNNNNPFSFNYPSNAYPNYMFNPTAPTAFTPSNTSISSFSSNAASSTISPVTNINTIVPFTNPIPISNNPSFIPTQFTSNPITQQDIQTFTTITAPTPTQINTHKRTVRSPPPLPSTTSSSKPITHVTSTITPTPVITTSTLSSTTPITSPITPTPVIRSTPTPFVAPTTTTTNSPTAIKTVNTITPVKSPTLSSPAITPTPPTPSKSNVTKFFGFGSFGKTGNYLSTIKEPEFKVDSTIDNTLFDLGLTAQTDLQFYDDYLTLSSSPTSMFDPINTLAEVDKIYEQWEQERGGPRLFE